MQCVILPPGTVNSGAGWFCRRGGCGEGLRRNRSDAAGAEAGRL